MLAKYEAYNGKEISEQDCLLGADAQDPYRHTGRFLVENPFFLDKISFDGIRIELLNDSGILRETFRSVRSFLESLIWMVGLTYHAHGDILEGHGGGEAIVDIRIEGLICPLLIPFSRILMKRWFAIIFRCLVDERKVHFFMYIDLSPDPLA